MKRKMMTKLLVMGLMAAIMIGALPVMGQAKSKGYVFSYKGVSVSMNGKAQSLLKKAGSPKKKVVKKSCAYNGEDRTYTYKDFKLKTYSKTNNGTEYVSEVRFLTAKVKTKEGIKIGSTQEQMEKKYGKAEETFGIYTYKKGSCKLQFMIEDGKVSAIRYFAA